MLLDRGCIDEASKCDSTTALHGAGSSAVKLLVERGFNLEARSSHNGMTPLLLAVRDCRTETVEILLELGADIHARDDKGDTALHFIGYHIYDTYLPFVNLLRYLITRGANVKASNHLGESPLHTIIGVLDPRYGGHESNSTLQRAYPKPITESVEILLGAGASVHSRDENGRTALHIAVSATNIEVIEVLLTAGADVAAKRKDGCTPLFEAVITSQSNVKWPSVVAIGKLIEFGADLNATNHEGKLVLHCLVDDARDLDDWEYRKTALSLLSNGINIGSRDSRGQTAKERTETLEKKDWIEFLANNEHYPRAA